LWAALDWAAAVALTVIVRELSGAALPHANTSPWLGLAVAAAMCLPAAARRRYPRAVLGALLAEPVLLTLAGYPSTAWPLFAAAFVLYSLTTTSSLSAQIIALGCTLAVLLAVTLDTLAHAASLHQSVGNIAFGGIATGVAVLAAWAIGSAVRHKRDDDHARIAAQARAVQMDLAEARRAVTEERLRIARELHDSVAHSMTLIAVRAGVGHHLIDSQPEEARAALDVIETVSRQALTEMRRLLGVLRAHDPRPGGGETWHLSGENNSSQPAPGDFGSAPVPEMSPAPGLGNLGELLDDVAQAGVQVSLHVTGRRRDLPAGVDLAAYRIVQEALTNVIKHSGNASCQLTVGYRDTEIVIDVTDNGSDCPRGGNLPEHSRAANGTTGAPKPAPAFDHGHGIVGMRERVRLYGGTLHAGPRHGGGFQVTAVIPVHADDQ
jgi:signal transduction histidine kinase